MALLALASLLAFCLPAGASSKSAVKATTPEVFLARPAPPSWWSRSGENWMAVFATAGGKRFDLKAVQSKVYVDSRDSVIKLGAQNSPDPAFFLAGLKLKAGPLDVAEKLRWGAALPLLETGAIDFTFKKEEWKLKRKTLDKRAGAVNYNLADVAYTLSNGKKEIELGRGECRLFVRNAQTACEEKIAIQFAGDLDRDGVPDLFVIEAPDRQGADAARLFLSSTKTDVHVADDEELRTQAKPYSAVIRKIGKDDGVNAKTPSLLVTGRPIQPVKNNYTFDTWYAFFNESKKLESVKIWVACLQGQCEESQRIEISKNETPLFLLRGIAGVKPGTTTEATLRKLAGDPDRDLGFDSYDLEFAGEKIKLVGGTGFYTIESAEKKTVFPLKTLDPDDKPKLVWAGDLDFDRKLDLYFEVKQDGGLAHLLYVSPEAATGPITGPTAKICSGNCD